MDDRFWHARVTRHGSEAAVHGGVVDICLDPKSGEKLYLIKYDDGDIEHYTKGQVIDWLAAPRAASGNAHPTGSRRAVSKRPGFDAS
eukprot:12895441-Prorocentrum_lima.AAC.1